MSKLDSSLQHVFFLPLQVATFLNDLTSWWKIKII